MANLASKTLFCWLSLGLVMVVGGCKDDKATGATADDLCHVVCKQNDLCSANPNCADSCKGHGTSLGGEECQDAFDAYEACVDSAQTCEDVAECVDPFMNVTSKCSTAGN